MIIAQGQKYTDNRNVYVVIGKWFKGFECTRIEIENETTKQVYSYGYEEFKTKIEEGIIKQIW
jgi:hypothetical protein